MHTRGGGNQLIGGVPLESGTEARALQAMRGVIPYEDAGVSSSVEQASAAHELDAPALDRVGFPRNRSGMPTDRRVPRRDAMLRWAVVSRSCRQPPMRVGF